MAFAVLIVPTVLMGATMPLVVRSSAFSGSLLGSRAGALYAANTVGAIAGTPGAGLFRIPQLGLRTSFTIAAAVNVLVGAAALVMARKDTSFAAVEYFLSLPCDRQVDLSSVTGDVDRYVDDGPSAR